MSGPAAGAGACRLIVNADDFGLSPAVSRGIVRAHGGGLLTSTTMLVNTDHVDDAAALARANPGLSVGVHLTLLWGAPVSEPRRVRSLVDGRGRFPDGLGTLAARYLLGRLRGSEVRDEFRRQLDRFEATGLRPSHLDTHKHIHCLGGVLDALLDVAVERGISKLRLPLERNIPAATAGPGLSAAGRRKRLLLALLCRGHRRKLAARGVRTTDHFIGVARMDGLNGEAFRFIFENAPAGVTELMCHPGEVDEAALRYGSRSPNRERELEGLLDPRTREAAQRRGIELVGWRDL